MFMGRSSLPKADSEDDQKERKGKRGKAAAIGVGGSRGLRRDAVSGEESPEGAKKNLSKIPIPTESLDCGIMMDDKSETRLYVGNLDKRITESNVIKMFTPFGKIISEEFLWHTRGPKRGEPRGYVFIQYSTKEEAQLAKAKMDGRLACGRPLVVRLASEKCLVEASNQLNPSCDGKKQSVAGSTSGLMNKSAKIAAIKNKLKSLEGEGVSVKRLRVKDNLTSSHEDVSTEKYHDTSGE